MTRSVSPRPRPKRRGRPLAQAKDDTDLATRVLGLPDRPRSELAAEWRRLWGSEVPRYTSHTFLVRAVAYGLQTEAYGGLDAQTRRLLKKASQSNGHQAVVRPCRLSKGSKLLREWNGEMHEVLVLNKGFAWHGKTYTSLSAIARAITGTNWNGWAFFGLKRRANGTSTNA